MTQKNKYLALTSIGIFPFLINGYINSKIYTSPIMYWSFELITWVVIPITVFVLLSRHAQLEFTEIGFGRTMFKNSKYEHVVLAGIAYAPISYLLYSTFLFLGEYLFSGNGLFAYQQIAPSSIAGRVIVALYLGLSAALVEEFYFRGLIFKISSFYKHSVSIYLIFSPLLFSLIHWENGFANVFATYLSGLISALIFLWLRNLWPLVIAHLYTDYMYFG